MEAIRSWLCGDRAAAEAALLDARRAAPGASRSWIDHELLLLRLALDGDDDERVRHGLVALGDALAGYPEGQALAWALAAELARKTGSSLPPMPALVRASLASLDPAELAAEVWLAEAAGARLGKDLARASAALLEARRRAPGGGRASALAFLELAEQRLASGDLDGARSSSLEALGGVRRLGLVIEEGRALLRHGEAVGAGVPDPEAAAVWLARAETRLGEAATFRDRARLRAGFHRHGRRLPDQALTGDALTCVESVDQASAALRSAARVALDQADRRLHGPSPDPAAAWRAIEGLSGELAAPLGQIHRASAELLELLAGANLERNRTRSLLLALTDLDKLDSVAALAAEAARVVAALLDAERVLLVRRREGQEPEVLGAAPAGAPGEDRKSVV